MVLVIQIFGLLVIGGVLFVFLRRDASFWSADLVRTRGIVLSHSSGHDSEGSVLFKSKVQFTDADGRVHEIDDWISYSAPRPVVGASIEVEYAAADSTHARVRHPHFTASFYVLQIAAGLLIVWTMLGTSE
jgi:hypothetical protein